MPGGVARRTVGQREVRGGPRHPFKDWACGVEKCLGWGEPSARNLLGTGVDPGR